MTFNIAIGLIGAAAIFCFTGALFYVGGGIEASKAHCQAVAQTSLYRVENGRIVCQAKVDVPLSPEPLAK